MKTVCALIIVAVLLLAAESSGNEGPAKEDFDQLRGTWLTVSLINDGKTLVDEKTPSMKGPAAKLVYEGNIWIVKVAGKTVAKGIFKIDVTKSPKEIDVLDESGVKNEKTKLGIYQVNGDTYKFCLARAGKARPTQFTSAVGSGYSLGVSKRERP
jgi:uncharacterized protein (TIGR03067 family)